MKRASNLITACLFVVFMAAMAVVLFGTLSSCSKESTAFQEVHVAYEHLQKQGFKEIQPSRREMCDSYDYTYRVAFRAIAPTQASQQTY